MMASAAIHARPKSRQSTTSINSSSTQPMQPQAEHPFNVSAQLPSSVWQQHEESLAHLGQQQFPTNYAIGAPMQPALGHHAQVDPFGAGAQVNGGPNTQMPPSLLAGQYNTIDDRGTPVMDVHMDDQSHFHPDHAGDSNKRKKGSANNQANDHELRRLLRENEGKELKDIAHQFQKDESTSKLEKLKQIFGMLWLKQHVRKADNHSVPRGSVFNEYSYCCGDFRLPTLNPASFGKLVRIIFPHISTRRLGVRGNSKYHYVDLALIVDKSKQDISSRLRAPSIANDDANQSETSKRAVSRPQAQLPADNAIFAASETPGPQPFTNNMRHSAPAVFYQQSLPTEDSQSQSLEPSLLPRPLKFPEALDRLQQRHTHFELPDITPYLPPGTDHDAANSLVSVYRSHCILAIDNFRYCKTEKFCESFKSLVGLLTVPGQKLLAAQSVAAWVRECDWRKYQSMIPMLNMIILTQVPQKATTHMQTVAVQLCNWIRHFFQTQTSHVLSAMLGPAGVFVSVLERFCRVQNAALQIAPIFDSVEKRNQLWADWVAFVNPLHVVQNSLAGWGHRRCRLILTREIVLLLSPTEGPSLAHTFFEDDGDGMTPFREAEMQKECHNSSDLIARLYRFLFSLKTRFPHAPAKEMLTSIERFTGNAARNMTLAGAQTVPEWWRIKVFMDEVSCWLAEMGGLFENDSEILVAHSHDLTNEALYDFGAFDAVDSRPATGKNQQSAFGSPDPALSHGHPDGIDDPGRPQSVRQSTQGAGSVPMAKQGARGKENEVHNDSGIGLGIEDDFNMDSKYNSFIENVNGSDPADVVVC